jgi:hypothetical protein
MYTLSTDTIINSLKYTLVGYQLIWGYSTDLENVFFINNYPLNPPGEIFGAIREDSTKKVWFINLDSTYGFPLDSNILLYDFNLEEGDTLYYPKTRIVYIKDSVKLGDSAYRTRFIFEEDTSDFWIEGMGSNLGLFGAFYSPYANFGNWMYWLNCFSENGDYIYHKSPFPEGITCDSTTYVDGPYQNIDSTDPTIADIHMNLNGELAIYFFQYNENNIKIINSIGQLVYNADVTDKYINLDISAFPSGLYFVIAGNNDKKLIKKVVKI